MLDFDNRSKALQIMLRQQVFNSKVPWTYVTHRLVMVDTFFERYDNKSMVMNV